LNIEIDAKQRISTCQAQNIITMVMMGMSASSLMTELTTMLQPTSSGATGLGQERKTAGNHQKINLKE
tara:strand:+ start:365 stop:568 length:204 start_codon:yes stop_codon:yes gene_type:complete